MEGFKVVTLNEVIRQVDVVITASGMNLSFLHLVTATSFVTDTCTCMSLAQHVLITWHLPGSRWIEGLLKYAVNKWKLYYGQH